MLSMPITIDANLCDSCVELQNAVKDKIKFYKEAIYIMTFPPIATNLTMQERMWKLELYKERLEHYNEFLWHLIYN